LPTVNYKHEKRQKELEKKKKKDEKNKKKEIKKGVIELIIVTTSLRFRI
jgi:hypothetical protein